MKIELLRQKYFNRADKFRLYKKCESPKFNVDDWITNGDYTWKVIDIKPLDYILQSQDGNVVNDTISHVDGNFSYFTIEDAKDGDVPHYEPKNKEE